jgi:hypothetical protein
MLMKTRNWRLLSGEHTRQKQVKPPRPPGRGPYLTAALSIRGACQSNVQEVTHMEVGTGNILDMFTFGKSNAMTC